MVEAIILENNRRCVRRRRICECSSSRGRVCETLRQSKRKAAVVYEGRLSDRFRGLNLEKIYYDFIFI